MNHLRSKAPGDMDLASGDGPGLEVYIGNCRLVSWGLPRWHSGEEPVRQCRRHKRRGFDPWVRKIPWRKKWHPTSVLPGESRGQRSLTCYSPWGCKESDTTEHTRTNACRGNGLHGKLILEVVCAPRILESSLL